MPHGPQWWRNVDVTAEAGASEGPPPSTAALPLAVYASAGSLRPGENIDFFVSSRVGPYTIKVYRQAADEVLMADIPDLPVAPNPLSTGPAAWQNGAQWPAVGRLQIPPDWPSGLYLARVEASSPADTVNIPFIVRAPIDGTQSRILLAMNDTTYEAYNYWGGRSLYGYEPADGGFAFTAPPSSGGPYAYRVSFRRPTIAPPDFPDDQNAKWVTWELPLIRWLARQGIRVEWCTMTDLHREPKLLDAYVLFVNVGHGEYWSNEMRDEVVSFVNQGGNAAFFGGNNCWWRVRIEDDGNTVVCYKDAGLDPTPDPSTLTTNWPDGQATELSGVSFANNLILEPRTDVEGQLLRYIVEAPGHWVFANTGLTKGDSFGLYESATGKRTIVGPETDLRGDTSPPGFETLAVARDRDLLTEIAHVGVFVRAGTVFAGSTIDWTLGLSGDDNHWGPLDQVTRNVFDVLGHPQISGQLLFYRDTTQNGTGDVANPGIIGLGGWQYLRFVFGGDNGIIYAVDQAGRLLFYRDTTQDGTGDVADPSVIGQGGWQNFKFLFSGGDGIIYAVDEAGRLLFYRDATQNGTGDVANPSVISQGGWQNFKFLFSGGDGIIYAVDEAGRLLFYRDTMQDGTGDVNIANPAVIGLGGWADFIFLLSGADGVIYAVTG